MEQELFSNVLGKAFHKVASLHGQDYRDGAARAWGETGAAYLGFAQCGLPSSQLRTIQYSTREKYGPVLLDCKWYDQLKSECLDCKKSIDTFLPGPNGTICQCTVTEELFLEMLDFCREG